MAMLRRSGGAALFKREIVRGCHVENDFEGLRVGKDPEGCHMLERLVEELRKEGF